MFIVTDLILKKEVFRKAYLHHFILFKKIAIVLESIRETIMPLFFMQIAIQNIQYVTREKHTENKVV